MSVAIVVTKFPLWLERQWKVAELLYGNGSMQHMRLHNLKIA